MATVRRIRGKGFGDEVEMPGNVVGMLPVELEAAGAATGVGATAIEGRLRAVAMRLGQERTQASWRRPCTGNDGVGARWEETVVSPVVAGCQKKNSRQRRSNQQRRERQR